MKETIVKDGLNDDLTSKVEVWVYKSDRQVMKRYGGV